MNKIGPTTRSVLRLLQEKPLDPPYVVEAIAEEHKCSSRTTRRLITALQNRNLITETPPAIGAGRPVTITNKGRSALAGNYHY